MAETTPETDHFAVFPARRAGDQASGSWEIAVPGMQSGWGIDAVQKDGHRIFCGVVEADRLVEDVLFDLMQAYPGGRDRVAARWIDEQGLPASIEAGNIDEAMSALMEFVCDETPDDAPDTDDHPLEELRSAFLELSDKLSEGPEPF